MSLFGSNFPNCQSISSIKGVLFHIVSILGNPLFVDATTLDVSRPSVARVYVEVDLLKALLSKIWIGNRDHEGFWQSLIPKNLPQYCSHCFRQGHDMEGCHVLRPELRSAKAIGTKRMEVA